MTLSSVSWRSINLSTSRKGLRWHLETQQDSLRVKGCESSAVVVAQGGSSPEFRLLVYAMCEPLAGRNSLSILGQFILLPDLHGLLGWHFQDS